MRMDGFTAYRTYLAFKQHFSNEKFDFFLYEGKVNAKEETYKHRNDFYFFETLARKLNDNEIKEYMLASFIDASVPSKVWIGDIKNNGKRNWLEWQKRSSGLTYIFTSEVDKLLNSNGSFNDLFDTQKGHPPLLKAFIRKEVCLETLVILDIILGFMLYWDRSMKDPLWETTSFKIKKYKPFLSINREKYTDILKTRVCL